MGSHQGYEPMQPIAYSHAVHAGTLRIPCLYCHYAALESRHAGVPPAGVCMNCHKQVRADHPEIQKVAASIPHEMRETPLEYVIKASFGFGDVNGCLLFKRWDGK